MKCECTAHGTMPVCTKLTASSDVINVLFRCVRKQIRKRFLFKREE